MFGRTPRGVSERPKTATVSNKAIPSWLWLIFFVLVGIVCLIYISLIWKPWTPVQKTNFAQPTVINSQDTNKDYRFYDLLPQQQVTPIPDQAVPKHQVKQPIVVVEAPVVVTTTDAIADPLEGKIQTAKITAPPRYILQVRSYEDPDSADARRAEIILNGLSAEVIMNNEGNKVWYRVISGPYESQETAYIAQQTLQNSGIDSIIVKQPTSIAQ